MKTANGFLNDKKVVGEYGEQAMSMKMKWRWVCIPNEIYALHKTEY